MSEQPLIRPRDVDAIVALDDQPVLRNLRITQSYHDLSERLRQLLGPRNANWCSYAKWASKTAGRFVRQEAPIPEQLQQLVLSTERSGLQAGAPASQQGKREAVQQVLDQIGLLIMTGNKIVYAELGGVFARFIEAVQQDGGDTEARFQGLLDTLPLGPPQPDQLVFSPDGRHIEHAPQGGQTMLRDCITHYRQALSEADPKRKAELILLANAEGGLHEQTRLQSYIERSLTRPLCGLLHGEWEALQARVTDPARGRLGSMLNQLLPPLSEQVQTSWRSFASQALMTMHLPDGTLDLSDDLPASPGEALFPPLLEKLENATLRSIFRKYGAYDARKQGRHIVQRVSDLLVGIPHALKLSPETAIGTGASDWASFPQRMRYIFELFRSRQWDSDLHAAPFASEQHIAILAGQLPSGPL